MRPTGRSFLHDLRGFGFLHSSASAFGLRSCSRVGARRQNPGFGLASRPRLTAVDIEGTGFQSIGYALIAPLPLIWPGNFPDSLNHRL